MSRPDPTYGPSGIAIVTSHPELLLELEELDDELELELLRLLLEALGLLEEELPGTLLLELLEEGPDELPDPDQLLEPDGLLLPDELDGPELELEELLHSEDDELLTADMGSIPCRLGL